MLIFEFPSAAQAEAFIGEVSQRFGAAGRVYLDQDEAYRDLWVPYELIPPIAAIKRRWFGSHAPIPEIEKIEDEIKRIANERGGLFRGT